MRCLNETEIEMIKNFLLSRDVEDTAERIAKKAALFSSNERGRELQAAHELKRRHQARAAEASAIGDKIEALRALGTALAKR